MLTRRRFLGTTITAGAGILTPWRLGSPRAEGAVAPTSRTPIAGSSLRQFVDPLPELDVILADAHRITLHMREFRAQTLPAGFEPASGTYRGTWVWGYLPGDRMRRDTHIGPVIVARRGVPTEVEYVNDLGDTDDSHLRAYTESTDQTLHWADPDGLMCSEKVEPHNPPTGACATHYRGSIPAVGHLHGGEVPDEIDGGPDAWFASDGLKVGHAFYSKGGTSPRNRAVYRYPNGQQSAPLWFHDHTLGATRLGVYAGLAGAYLLVDPRADRPDLPPPVPLVIQDRMFDAQGQLFFPAGIPYIPNPEHPFWVPEFIGDTILVNGKVWPHLEVEQKRYRFVVVNGSNARAYELFLVDQRTKAPGPAMWQIATDGGYLDRPVRIDPDGPAGSLRRLVLMPGERAVLIVDFAGLAPGTRLLLRNTANAPLPSGDAVDPRTTGRVMQFRVVPRTSGDTTFDPSTGGALRRPMVRLADPIRGIVATAVEVRATRQLTLNEVIGDPSTVGGIDYEGGPLEVLLNNSELTGESTRPYGDFVKITTGGVDEWYSEVPREGETEVWELVNLTADAHPIHLHLVQFQLVNRQRFDVDSYEEAYRAAFPDGTYVPGWGPPRDYRAGRNPLSGGKEGGNPDVGPHLLGGAHPPAPNEAGWKDTIQAPPGMVTRLVVRWAPTDLPASTRPRDATFAFTPDGGHGYVWHCHIVDHEDNEMMRPTSVVARDVRRSYVRGVDY